MGYQTLFTVKNFLLALIVALLGILVIFPRAVELLNHNYLFGFDQGRDYLRVKDIVVDHKFTLIGAELGAGSAGISGIHHGPGFYYLLAIPFILMHGDPYGGQILMFILGVLTVIMAYVLGAKLWGIWSGFLVAFLTAISPPLVSASRFIWDPNAPPVFILLSFYFLYRFLEKRNVRDIFLAAALAAINYNFESAVAIPLCLTIFIFLILSRTPVKYIFTSWAGFFVSFLPMIIFEVRHHFMAIQGFLAYVKAPKGIGPTFIQTMISHKDAFILNAADPFPKQGLLPWLFVFMILILFPLYLQWREKNIAVRNLIRFFVLLLPVNIFVFSFLRNTVYQYYLTDLTIAYLLLFAYSLISVYSRRILSLSVIFGIYFVILLLTAGTMAYTITKNDLSDYGGTAKIKGIQNALDTIFTDAKGEKFGLLVFAPPVYTYQYDYLIWWYGERKYHYLPPAKKDNTFYLLIEPDPYKPWSYNGWLDTVIKTGTVVSTETLKSGFIIQKRTP